MSSREELCRQLVFSGDTQFSSVKRSDIVGIDRILDELDHYVEYLKNFEKVEKYQVELNAGILFAGDPGTGKTLCARYIATESNAKFIDVEAFERVYENNTPEGSKEVFVGELFRLAREYVEERNVPVVLFFDEFNYFLTDPNVISELTQELSGIKGKAKGVFVVATTNSPQQIEEALLRDGRIGEKIYFSPPNREAKLSLLKHYAKKEPRKCADDIDFDSLSFLIEPSAVPSTIEEIVNKAWRYSCMYAISSDQEPVLTQETLLKTLLEDMQGVADNTILTDQEFRSIAIYEIGRALVSRTLGCPTQLIALYKEGYSNAFRIEDFDRPAYLALDMYPKLATLNLAGIQALKIFDIPRNTGVLADFAKATECATVFVEDYKAGESQEDFSGMSFRGLVPTRDKISVPVTMGIPSALGHKNIKGIDEFLKACEDDARKILEYYKAIGVFDKLFNQLSEKGRLLQKDIDEFIVSEIELINTENERANSIGQYL